MTSLVNANVLLVSDDSESGGIMARVLGLRGLQVTLVHSVEEALDWWSKGSLHLALIDFGTHPIQEITMCCHLRDEITKPILLLSSRSTEAEVLEAYKAGADECIVKSVSPRILVAKIKAWLRRSWNVPVEALASIQAGCFTLDPAQRQVVTPDRDAIPLTNLEFRLLYLLMAHRGRTLETESIIERVWGYNGGGDSNLLQSLVYRLRHKLEPDPRRPRYIQTRGSVGYVFRPD